MKKRLTLLCMMTVLASALPLLAQPELQVTDGVHAAELFGASVRDVTLSPNGELLAGIGDDEICIHHLETRTETCVSLPEAFRGGLAASRVEANPLSWSHDSRYIAFTENFYVQLHESDLWIFDVAEGTITNLTEDNLDGDVLSDEPVILDYLPVWGIGDELYFFRSAGGGNANNVNLTLQRLALGEETPEPVADLTRLLPRFSIFYNPAVSPDGTRLAIPVQGRERDDPANGLWVIELETGDAKQIASQTAINTQNGLNTDDQPFIATPTWVNDGAGIVMRIISLSSVDIPLNFVYIDVNAGRVTPLIDFTDVVTRDLYQVDPPSDIPRVPLEGAVSVDGETFYYLERRFAGEESGVYALSLPPTGELPTLVDAVDYEPTLYAVNPQARGNRALIGGWLYTLEAE